MTLTVSNIPSAVTSPTGAAPSVVRSQIVSLHFSRRSLFKAILATGVAVGLATLDGVARLAGAHAAPSSWGDCPNWEDLPGAANDWKICNPDGSASGRIGKGYCGSNGYHRKDTVVHNPLNYTVYSREPRCLNKNAWVWKRNGSGWEPRDRRCSDGRTRRYHDEELVSNLPSTCQKILPTDYP